MADYEMLGSSHLCRTFDDCDLAYFHTDNLLLDEGVLQWQPQQTSNHNIGSVAAASTDAWKHPTCHRQRPHPQANHEQSSLPSEDFVSAYVVIDPSQPDRILVPHQLLTYMPPWSTEPQTISWGPVVLPSSLIDTCISSTTEQDLLHWQAASLPPSSHQEFPELVNAKLDDACLDKVVSDSEPNDEKLHIPVALHSTKKIGQVQSSTMKIVTLPTRKKKECAKRRRKSDTDREGGHDGKPRLLKPLTAYNFYYRDERDNIIFATGDLIPPPVSDFSEGKSQKLLEDRWLKDPTKEKRKHRRTHGKMEFAE